MSNDEKTAVYMIPSNVTRLRLGDCAMMGTVPTQIGRLTALNQLDTNYNFMSGTLPTEMGLLTDLGSLFVSANRFISGTIPTEVGNLRWLKAMGIQENMLSGSLPTELGHLRFVDNASSEWEGRPGDWPVLTTAQNGMRLFGNSISGHLPTQLALLTQAPLKLFYAHRNAISGTFPEEIVMAIETDWMRALAETGDNAAVSEVAGDQVALRRLMALPGIRRYYAMLRVRRYTEPLGEGRAAVKLGIAATRIAASTAIRVGIFARRFRHARRDS